MRTYEDVKLALQRYKKELDEESKSKTHYVVMGGNLSIIRKGRSTQYTLGKGEPISMVKETAKKNLEKFQSMVTGDVELKIIPYKEWLQSNIMECERLIQCMQRSLSGEPTAMESIHKETTQISQQEPINDTDGDYTTHPIEMTCDACPLGVKLCMVCKFCTGVKTDIYPWQVICSVPHTDNQRNND